MSVLTQIASKLFGADPIFARSTPGGVHTDAFKQHSLRSRIMSTPIPQQLTIPIGDPKTNTITLLVKPGQRVRKYQQLASIVSLANDHSSIAVHAPTSGIVTHFEMAAVADHRQQEQMCVWLQTDGQDEALVLEGVSEFSSLSPAQITTKIRDAGIIGMGGAGFPTADKLSSAENFDIDLLIINAAECEPYISADEALIRERAAQTLLGAEILRRACSASRVIITIEDSKPDAIEALRDTLASRGSIAIDCTIVLVPSKYPAGSEKQLIHCVSGIEIPSGQFPVQSGILVQNIGSAYAVYEAIVEGKPCVSRITTLCGETLQTPKNFEVLIGTPVSFLFDLCGIEKALTHRSVVGGSLMGRELPNDEAAVCKTTNCLIAAGPGDFPAPTQEQACIRCGYCADACPVKLLPQQLLAFSKTRSHSALLDHGLLDCIECGACDYVCPSHIPLVSIYKESKNSLMARRQDADCSEHWQLRFQQHQFRLKKDKDQSLARKANSKKSETKTEAPEPSKSIQLKQEFFSKDKASREIAAAVARVKARRSENAPGGSKALKDKPPE